MRLRSRSVIISIGLVCSLALILFLYSHVILMQGYIDLEEQYARKNVYQVIKAVRSETATLDMITVDSAANNDAYLYMITERQKYIQDNLLNDTLYDLGINFALL